MRSGSGARPILGVILHVFVINPGGEFIRPNWASGGMADARGLGPRGETLAGSSPVSPTIGAIARLLRVAQ